MLLVGLAAELSTNYAFGQPTWQSSTDPCCGAGPSRAVDANVVSDWATGTCTYTNVEAYAWWAVDLGQVISVTDVVITNRV